MPKEIINMTLERKGKNEPWGFVIIGGKDQALTVKVGRVRAYSAAEKAGLKSCDYIWQINGKEVFEMSHNECVKEVKDATTMLSLNIERGDHIVPHFEEIWPSGKSKDKYKRGHIPMNYYTDAMENGPQLSGHLPIPANFTTVGKPAIYVNQYDNPIDVYSEDTIEEMKEERISVTNPEAAERVMKHRAGQMQQNPLAAAAARKFDTSKSAVLGLIGKDDASRSK